MSEDWRDLNRKHWDERVPVHVRSPLYDLPGFKAGASSLGPEEARDLGDVRGLRLVHLQCHFGQDTLSWARLGARVTGLDFSPPAIEAARGLATELGIEAEFVVADVYDAPRVLSGPFDVVYTGVGALCWLPDIHRWASTVAALLRPGGQLYLREFHPFEWIFAADEMTVAYDYFTPPSGLLYENSGSYADPTAVTKANQTRLWNHGLGQVVTALARAGLTIRELREENASVLPRWPFLVPADGGTYTMPADRPSFPFMYTLRATR